MDKENLPILAFLFSVLVIFVSVTGCETQKENHTIPVPNYMELDNTSEYYNQHYRVYTLEGCEYIKVDVGNTSWGSHKGNCKNQIHKQNGSN